MPSDRTTPISVEEVDQAVHYTPYMTLEQARTLQRLWNGCPAGDILELGFAYGKGSAYLGALAAQKGRRAVCVDNQSARDRRPRADLTIRTAGVADHVDLLFTDNGYVWWMKQQLEHGDIQRYGLVYLDGAHDWFVDGFAALLSTGSSSRAECLSWTISTGPSRHRRHRTSWPGSRR